MTINGVDTIYFRPLPSTDQYEVSANGIVGTNDVLRFNYLRNVKVEYVLLISRLLEIPRFLLNNHCGKVIRKTVKVGVLFIIK